MLKSIQLSGFKSFAKKGELSFDSPITAIVGPNGSGKSNTAEAFRFVLGEQGSKSMRVKKGTDLIWGGSHTLPRASRAGVKVVLDNSKNTFGVDFDEVVIERSVLQDGTNEYLLNGSKVRLKDIQDLLTHAHIGSSGHHIISQGEADRILGASPKERREMLEDALGLKVYQLKKGEAKRKLETTTLNLEKAESRRRELLPHLKFLKRQVDKAQEARQLQEKLQNLAGVYVVHERAWLTTEKEALQEAYAEPSIQMEEVKQQMEVLRTRSKGEQDTEAQQASKARMQEEKEKLISLRSTLAELRTELGRVTGQREMLQVVEQKTAALPLSISRKKVQTFLDEILTILKEESDKSVAEAQALAERFAAEHLGKKDEEKPQDTALEQEREQLRSAQRELQEQVAGQERAIAQQETVILEAQASSIAEQQRSTEYERDMYKLEAEYNELRAVLQELDRRDAERTNREALLAEDIIEVQAAIGQELTFATGESVQQVPERKEVERLKIQLEQHGSIGSEVLTEYAEAQKHHDYLNQEIQDLHAAAQALESLITELDVRMETQFTRGIDLINREFSSFFSTLFDGGDASLVLQDIPQATDENGNVIEEVVQQGVEVRVALPRKKVTTLETLSGGERALASIALIFAMSQVNPPPFIILDETDAALDEANSQRYASIVKRLSEKSQVILITHNRATMAAADTLYGVTMGSSGVSELLSVRLTDAQQYAK